MPHFDLLTAVLGLVLGAIIGAAGGLLGIGGGLLAIPVLGVFFGLDQQHAQGTSIVMVVPNVFVGLLAYARREKMDVRLALALAAGAIPFTYLGAYIATHVASAPLRRGFAFFLTAQAAYFLLRTLSEKRSSAERVPRASWPWAGAVGAGGGLVSGMFSVGGAVFAVPLLTLLFGITQAAAQGLGLALVAPGTLVGLVAYVRAGDVDWQLAIPLAIGGVLFVKSGVTLAHRLPEHTLRMIFTVALVASALALFWKG